MHVKADKEVETQMQRTNTQIPRGRWGGGLELDVYTSVQFSCSTVSDSLYKIDAMFKLVAQLVKNLPAMQKT